MSLIVIAVFLGLALLRMPLALALGASAVAGLIASDVEFNLLPSRMMSAVNAFPLMSIPFFILAGELMLKAGMMERLIDLANAVIGRVRGGLAHVTVLAGMGLSTVSGAAVADASALGSTLLPSLKKHYGVGFSAAVCAAAANLGPIIPPSGAMIVYAFMAGPTVSVGGLFMAGIVPGLLLVVGMLAMCSYIAHKRQFPLTGEAFSLARVLAELRRSFIIFMMPVVVIGGIVGGAFTATEGSAVAVVYALLIGFFVTRKLSLSDLPEGAGAHRAHLGGGRRDDRVRLGRDLHADDRPVARPVARADPVDHLQPARLPADRLGTAVRGRHVPRIERGLHHAGAAAAPRSR